MQIPSWVHYATAVLAAASAGLAAMPFSWSHYAASGVAIAVASLTTSLGITNSAANKAAQKADSHVG
jgi:hypothetical protein